MNSGHNNKEKLLRGWFLAGLSGDRRAYSRFLTEVDSLLHGYFFRRLASLPGEIDDLTQETLFAIHDKRWAYNPRMPLRAWIFAIAHYKLVDLMRHRQCHERLTCSLDHCRCREPVAPGHDEMAEHDLAILLGRLPAHQRLLITQTKLQGLSIAETARRDGMSESSVKINVHRGIKALRKLARDDIAPPIN